MTNKSLGKKLDGISVLNNKCMRVNFSTNPINCHSFEERNLKARINSYNPNEYLMNKIPACAGMTMSSSLYVKKIRN